MSRAVLLHPDREEPERSDPSLRHALDRIEEHDGRVLRLIYNATEVPSPIVTVSLDHALRNRL